MNKILLIKRGATGDVVRTTPLLRKLEGKITWITDDRNIELLQGLPMDLTALAWTDRVLADNGRYSLIINLEDDEESADFAAQLPADARFGAVMNGKEGKKVEYTIDSADWFDLSLISIHGRKKADELKFRNRKTYQDMIFSGLGYSFAGEEYVLPDPQRSDLTGDVAISPIAGTVWPMKNWAYYHDLRMALEAGGLVVNELPLRESLREHLADIQAHRCLVSGDSLPMHFALGSRIPCVSIFTCTSPWEIHDYGIQRKVISPLLGEFFYKRGFEERATRVIALEEVLEAVREVIDR